MGSERLAAYVPDLALGWDDPAGRRWREVEGTIAFADLSGFTRLSERLARLGRDGAEIVKDMINSVFEPCIAAVLAHDGDVVKFAGDGLMCLFAGDDHQRRAAAAAAAMQHAVRAAGRQPTPAGPARLSISIGVDSGTFLCLLTRAGRDELVVTGPTVDDVFAIEGAARPGQVLVGQPMAAALPPRWTRADSRSGHRLLQLGAIELAATGRRRAPPIGIDAGRLLAPQVRSVLEQGDVPAEHRSIAVAFVTLSGIGALLDAGGPDHLLEQVDRFAAVIDDACASAEVCWLETDADRDQIRVLLTAGAPLRSDIDEQRIVDAVWSAVSSPHGLAVRAGVSRGRVFVGDVGHADRRAYNVMGDAVNVAARLAARAGAGEILAIDAVVAAQRSMVLAEAVAPMTVKGRRQPLAVSRIVGFRPRRDDSGRHRALVGREQQLQMLLDACDRAARGQGGAFEIVGAPGLGKSHLVAELARRVAPLPACTMVGELYDRSTPYGASAGMIRQIAGVAADLDPPAAGAALSSMVKSRAPQLNELVPLVADAARAVVDATSTTDSISEEFRAERIHEAVESFVSTFSPGPLLVVAEDTHWFDDASRGLLQAMARASGPAQWLIVATRRPGGAALGGATVIELEPLDADGVRALVIDAIGDDAMAPYDLARVVEQAGGNPLFARELAASLAEGDGSALPDQVERVVASRIDNLPTRQRTLLRDVSVAGARADLALVGEALGDETLATTAPWEPLAEFVGVDGNALAFHHDLYRVAAYDGLAYRRRRELHSRFATLLAGRPDAEYAAARISHHAHEAGQHEMTWRWARIAAETATSAGAVVEAAEHYERALAAAERLGSVAPADVAPAAEALGDAHELLGHTERAHAGYRRARHLTGDTVAISRLYRKHARVAERAGEYRSSLTWCTKGLHLLDPADESAASVAARADLRVTASGARLFQGQFRAAMALAQTAAADAERSGNAAALAQAHLRLEVSCSELGLPDRAAHGRRALELFESLGDNLGLANLHLNLGVSSYNEGRWNDALEHYGKSITAYEKVGDAIGAEATRNNQAEILTDQGRYGEAGERLADARRALKAANYRIGVAITSSGQARLALRWGRFDDATTLLDEARREFVALDATNMVLDTDVRRVELLVWAGRPAEALALAAEAEVEMDRLGPVAILPATLWRLRGWAHAASGAIECAERELSLGLALAREDGVLYEVALALDALDAVRAGRGGSSDPAALEERDRLLTALGVIGAPRPPQFAVTAG